MVLPREAQILVVLVIVIAVLAMLIQFVRLSSFDSDASRFVLEDLRSKHPEADIEIMSISSALNEEGEEYLTLKARLTQKPGTACPERSHIFYNYPTQNFVAQPPEVITSGCMVCQESPCVIAFPEEAVIASHTRPGSERIKAYLDSHKDASARASESADSWLVIWDSRMSGYYAQAHLDKSGNVLEASYVDKP